MSTLHHPLKAEIADKLVAAGAAADAGDVDSAIFSLLDVFAALGRDSAQRSWLTHHDAEDRDDRMSDAVDELVFQALQFPLSQIYPELPGQVRSVLLDAFDDEFFKLEDPLGWAEVSGASPNATEVLS